jgi:hypothetical protein
MNLTISRSPETERKLLAHATATGKDTTRDGGRSPTNAIVGGRVTTVMANLPASFLASSRASLGIPVAAPARPQ